MLGRIDLEECAFNDSNGRRMKNLACGSSIAQNGRRYKQLKRLALGAGWVAGIRTARLRRTAFGTDGRVALAIGPL